MSDARDGELRITCTAEAPSGLEALAADRGLFFHDPRWVGGSARFFRYRTHWLSAHRGAALAGALPLAEVPPLLAPRRLVSLPFSYAAGPVGADAEVRRRLSIAARDLAADRGIGLLEIKSLESDGPPPPSFERRLRYLTYRITTADGAETVWRDGLDEGTRRGVRRARTRGVVVESRTDPDSWQRMARLAEHTFHTHGVPSPPRGFFLEFVRGLQSLGLADLLLARGADDRTLAGIIVWKTPRMWYYAYGASDPDGLADRPNHALLWHAVEAAAVAGAALDLGRAAPEQTGLTEFKRRWGGAPVPLAYDYWPRARGLNVGARDRGQLGRAAQLWSRLPRPLVRAGSFLYRYLG